MVIGDFIWEESWNNNIKKHKKIADECNSVLQNKFENYQEWEISEAKKKKKNLLLIEFIYWKKKKYQFL